MIALYDHMQQLQAELRNTPSRRERAVIVAELKTAVAEQTALDREFDRMFKTLSGEGTR